MRIRKNKKVSSMLLASGGEKVETHVCYLNQSPWDVIPFTSSDDGAAGLTNNPLDSSSWFLPSSSSSYHQLNGEDSFNGNVSLGDSNGASDSVVSIERLDLIAGDEPIDRSESKSDNVGKKSKSLEPNSSSDKTSGNGGSEQIAGPMPAAPKRGRPRGSARKAPVSAAPKNPYEFYYYSGFGPRWGRKRGSSGENGEKKEIGDSNYSKENSRSKKSSSNSNSSDEDNDRSKTTAYEGGSNSSSSYGGFDEEEEEEEDDDGVDEDSYNRKTKKKKKSMMTKTKTKKRGRKPVKERSLKSLM